MEQSEVKRLKFSFSSQVQIWIVNTEDKTHLQQNLAAWHYIEIWIGSNFQGRSKVM